MVGGNPAMFNDHTAAHCWLNMAVRCVEPVEIIRVIGLIGSDYQFSFPIFGQDVLGDGGRFCESDVAILDYWCSACGMSLCT